MMMTVREALMLLQRLYDRFAEGLDAADLDGARRFSRVLA